MKQNLFLSRGKGILFKKISAGFTALAMTLAMVPTSALAVTSVYSITGSGSVTGALVELTGTSHANPQTGANNSQHMAVDWDEDMDNDPDTGTGWEEAPAGGLEFDPVFFGGNTNNADGFDDNDWDASHTYTVSGTYNITVMVYHGNTPGNDGSDSSTFTFEATVVVDDVCDNIDGNQETVPDGFYEEGGSCYEIPVDVCDNIDGVQETVPDGMEILTPGQCTDIVVDLCDNIDGVQETVPDGYTEEGGVCTPVVVDVCDNIDGDQETVPDGYYEEGGSCYMIPVVDVCDNIDGDQETVPDGYYEEGGSCYEIPPVDVCDNIDGDQETVPDGYYEDGGSCYETPAEAATIVVTKVVCEDEAYLPDWGADGVPEGGITENTATDFLNDVNEEGEVCYQVVDWTFQWAPEDTPDPEDNVGELDEPWTPFTESTTINLDDLGENHLVKVREVWNEAYLGFAGAGAGTEPQVSAEMYCDADTVYYDNVDYIDGVEAGETYYCVAFNVKIDVCDNLEGVQESVPEGMEVSEGQCTDIVIDVCENLEGTQEEVPEGYYEEGGNCYEDEPVDVCENIDGDQSEVPEGFYESGGMCYEEEDNGGGGPTVQTDVCPNIAGNQLQIPDGYAYVDGQCLGGGAAVFLPGNPGGSGGPAGIVLGATTIDEEEDLPEGCGEYLQDYLRIGRANNEEQVMKLQDFLNRHINAGLPVTGYFGPLTFAAVQQFQVENADQILSPWVPHGLESTQVGTGYVFKTTKRWINILECSSLDIPMPNLP